VNPELSAAVRAAGDDLVQVSSQHDATTNRREFGWRDRRMRKVRLPLGREGWGLMKTCRPWKPDWTMSMSAWTPRSSEDVVGEGDRNDSAWFMRS
jgi:hypothetical protein